MTSWCSPILNRKHLAHEGPKTHFYLASADKDLKSSSEFHTIIGEPLDYNFLNVLICSINHW